MFLIVPLLGWAQNDTVVFSSPGGFYADVFSLELYNAHSQNHIRYTTNGNRPTAQSQRYTEPLVLDEHLYSKSDIYTIQISPEEFIFIPDSIRHCIVIRAAVFDENDSCISPVATNSYFIRTLGCDTHGLPAISLCADSLDLFDYERGIMVPGITYDPLNPNYSGNYCMGGKAWERLCNVEFYELDNQGINQEAGLRTHGKSSRLFSQKGLKIYAREEYGKKRFKHEFFETIPHNSFKHLVLKPFSSTWNGGGCCDYLCNHFAQSLNVESLASRPFVLFINGEYWGVYFLGEKPDERYLEDHFNINLEQVNIIGDWYGHNECGSSDNFNALFDWMEQADLRNQDEYAFASQRIDIENFIDYQIFEIFTYNLDWPANNVRFWQQGDGKFRWIFFDGDGCLQIQDFAAFANATYEGDDLYPSSKRATLFFRKLLENPDFKSQFVSRFAELVGTHLSYASTKPVFDHIKDLLEDEVNNQVERFHKPSSFDSWLGYSMYEVNRFLELQPDRINDSLKNFIYINEYESLVFQCYPNPSSQEIHLHLDAQAFSANEIAIYNLMGQKVFSMPCLFTSGTNEITLHPDLAPGVYLLNLGRQTHRIVRY